MHPSLKNVTERAQKCDFSVNFHILIEQTGSQSRPFVTESESWQLPVIVFFHLT